MKLKNIVLIIALSFGLTFAAGAVTQTTNVSADKTYRAYKTMPKVLRGTWRTGYLKYGKTKTKVRWTYKFNKTSYYLTMSPKGKHSKTFKFAISYMLYRYKTKHYEFTGVTTKKNGTYNQPMEMKPVHHNGKKALGYYNTSVTKPDTYYYYVHK